MRRCVIMFGCPGSGKGTQAKKLTRMEHLSTGALLRAAGYDLSTATLINDDTTNKLVVDRIEEGDFDFVLDGYPRTVPQAEYIAEYLQAHGIETLVMFLFIQNLETVIPRMLNRNEGRPDDKEDVIRERLRVYLDETLPALKPLALNFRTWSVNASKNVEAVHQTILKCLANDAPCECGTCNRVFCGATDCSNDR